MQELLLLYSLMTEDFCPPTIPLVLHSPEFFGKTEPPGFPEQNEYRKSPVLHRHLGYHDCPIPENIPFLSGSALPLFPESTAVQKTQESPCTALQPATGESSHRLLSCPCLWQQHKEPVSSIPDPFSSIDMFFVLFFL